MTPDGRLPPRPIDLAAMIRGHPFIRIEPPAELWQPDALDDPFIRAFGELIAASLVRNGHRLGEVTIQIANVVVDSADTGSPPPGEFVAITAIGPGDWGPELARRPAPGAAPPLVTADVEAAAANAGVAWAYSRRLGGDRGSVTLWYRRRRV